MRSVLFCNEMLGLGHLRLSLVVAEALAARDQHATALVVTGSPAFGGLRLAPRVDILKLPTAPVGPDSRWSATGRVPSAGLALAAAQVHELRTHLSLAIVEGVRPDVVVVDYRPLGRNDELLPVLERLRARGDCTIALGLWDVDDSPERLRSQWTPALQELVGRLYDLALVYGPPPPGDPRVTALQDVGVPVHVTGLIGVQPARHGPADLEDGYLLVTAGGGVDGFALLDTVLAAIRARPIDIPVTLVTGPLMATADVARLHERTAGLSARVLEHRNDMDAVIAGARATISMAGYCTTAEILASGKPALLVPRAFPREEQLNRARALAAAGRVAMLHPDDLDAVAMRRAIDDLLRRSPTAGDPLTGAADAARILG